MIMSDALESTLHDARNPLNTAQTLAAGMRSDLSLGATIAAPEIPVTVTGTLSRTASSVSVLPRVELAPGGTRNLLPTEGPRYQHMKSIGEGGMGEVALAEDRDIGRMVALKRLHPGAASQSPGALARFVDEVRIVGSLEHPNIVPIHDVGVDAEGRFFFVMTFVDGQTLESIIEKLRAGDPETVRRFDMTRRTEIFVGILRALEYAHGRGYLHRDIKPANVMVGRHGEVVLMDWGVARPIGGASDTTTAAPAPAGGSATLDRSRASATHVGALIGTPLYMSPEQAEGKTDALDVRSDLFSAAVLFHELCGLTHRFEHIRSLPELLVAAQKTPPPHNTRMFAASQQKDVPAELTHFLHKALQLRPEDRWASAEQMVDELHAILDGRCRVQCPVTLMKRTSRGLGRFVDRHPIVSMWIVSLSALALVGLVGIAVHDVLT